MASGGRVAGAHWGEYQRGGSGKEPSARPAGVPQCPGAGGGTT